MKFSIITLFPEVFEPILNSSILKRAQQKNLVKFELIDLRQFGQGNHKTVDDKPFGGGVGMVIKPDVLKAALDSVFKKSLKKPTVLLTSASGSPYKQTTARKLSKVGHLVVICGHYEGVDQRFIDNYVDLEVSIGDYVLTGGEIPAMVLVDSITRLVEGVLEKKGATENESFENGLLEYPQYTRPQSFEGYNVPEILTGGDHQKIAEWREKKAIEKTKKIRPDLIS